MPGHLTPKAKEIADAINAGLSLETAAAELLAEVGPIARPVAIDIGARLWLVAMPGWTAARRASEYVHIADEVA